MISIRIQIDNINNKTYKKSSLSSTSVSTNSLIISKVNNNFSIKPLDTATEVSSHERKIAKIKKTDRGFELNCLSSKLKSYSDDFWLVINKANNPFYFLQENDVVRVFNSYFLIQKLSGFNIKYSLANERTIENVSASPTKETRMSFTKDILLENTSFCRFCLDSKEPPNDPFISPCKCKGTMGYLHYSCFLTWVSLKLTVRYSECFTFINWETIFCEFCRAKINEESNFGSVYFNLFENFYPSSKFIIIKKVSKALNNKNQAVIVNCEKGQSLFLCKNGEVVLGKEKNSFEIEIKNEAVFLVNKSKALGLFVLQNRKFEMISGSKMSFVNGSSLMKISVIKRYDWKKLLCGCLAYKNEPE